MILQYLVAIQILLTNQLKLVIDVNP